MGTTTVTLSLGAFVLWLGIAALIGAVACWYVWPEVIAWWRATTTAARRGTEQVLIVVGTVAIIAVVIWGTARFA